LRDRKLGKGRKFVENAFHNEIIRSVLLYEQNEQEQVRNKSSLSGRIAENNLYRSKLSK
jgi:hypothetical protein